MGFSFSDLNPFKGDFGDVLTNLAVPGSQAFGDYRNLLIPGNPEAVQLAASENTWNRPYGSEPTSWDYLGGGRLADDPNKRAIGRRAGTAAGLYFGGQALAGYAGGGGDVAAGSYFGESPGTFYGGETAAGSGSYFGEDPGLFFGEEGAGSYFGESPDMFFGEEMAGSGLGDNYSWWDDVMSPGGGGGSSPAGSSSGGTSQSPSRRMMEEIMRKMRIAKPYLSAAHIASGIYGLTQAGKMGKAATDVDPMGPYRPQYAQQAAALAADPSLVTKYPGYQAGLQAVERRMASQGYLGSGNMMLALANHGGEFYNREMGRLAGLATPSPGVVEGNVRARAAANQLRGQSLASIGFGAYGLL